MNKKLTKYNFEQKSRDKFHDDFIEATDPLCKNPNPIGRTIIGNKLWNDHLRRIGLRS